ncbi:MAG: sugar phosphate isomerase/epimerase family protein [Phycisphaerales bacterium]
MTLPIGLQLYTLRDVLKVDLPGALERVARIGYRGVEWAGFYDHKPAELRKMLDDLGLKSAGIHNGIDALQQCLPGVVETAKVLGHDCVTVPWIGEEYRSVAGYTRLAYELSGIGAKLKESGITLCYHNHDFEFVKQSDGRTGFEILIQESVTGCLSFEVDMGWVYVGTGTPPEVFASKLTGRAPLLHIKDFKHPPEGKTMCELGSGAVDYRATVAQAAGWGTRWLIVEQDTNWMNNDPMASVTTSYAALKRLTE